MVCAATRAHKRRDGCSDDDDEADDNQCRAMLAEVEGQGCLILLLKVRVNSCGSILIEWVGCGER